MIDVRKLVFIAFEINVLLDNAERDNLGPAVVRHAIEDGTILDVLERSRFHTDLSGFSPEDRSELVAEWQSMDNAIDTHRKFGVEHGGLNIWLGYVLQGIQNRAVYPERR